VLAMFNDVISSPVLAMFNDVISSPVLAICLTMLSNTAQSLGRPLLFMQPSRYSQRSGRNRNFSLTQNFVFNSTGEFWLDRLYGQRLKYILL